MRAGSLRCQRWNGGNLVYDNGYLERCFLDLNSKGVVGMEFVEQGLIEISVPQERRMSH